MLFEIIRWLASEGIVKGTSKIKKISSYPFVCSNSRDMKLFHSNYITCILIIGKNLCSHTKNT